MSWNICFRLGTEFLSGRADRTLGVLKIGNKLTGDHMHLMAINL
jgi:hypothetical protein